MKYFKYKDDAVIGYYRVYPDDSYEWFDPIRDGIILTYDDLKDCGPRQWNPPMKKLPKKWAERYKLFNMDVSNLNEISEKEMFVELL